MRECTYLQAINEALDEALASDSRVFLIGEDIGVYGGGFGATKNLLEKYGEQRVRSTPISESAIVGLSVGAAMTGMRPVIELQFSDFITIAMDQLVNQAAKMSYLHNGKSQVPLVLRTAAGSGTGAAAQHSQSLESWLAHIPGLKVVQPATPADAKGLLLAAIADNNPVIVYEHKLAYKLTGEVPEGYYTVPLGKAAIRQTGVDITLVATGIMVERSLAAAQDLAAQGIYAEVIDLRSLVPLDMETVTKSVAKTKRVLLVTEAVEQGSFVNEIIAQLAQQELIFDLHAPIRRLGGAAIAIPAHPVLEQAAVPQVDAIKKNILEMLAFKKDGVQA